MIKISSPIPIKIIPPNISALLPSLAPNFFPIYTDNIQMTKVTTAINPQATSALIIK